MSLSIKQLMRLIGERVDPDELVDILGYSTDRLCLLLRKEIINNREKFEEYLDAYECSEFDEWEDEDEIG